MRPHGLRLRTPSVAVRASLYGEGEASTSGRMFKGRLHPHPDLCAQPRICSSGVTSTPSFSSAERPLLDCLGFGAYGTYSAMVGRIEGSRATSVFGRRVQDVKQRACVEACRLAQRQGRAAFYRAYPRGDLPYRPRLLQVVARTSRVRGRSKNCNGMISSNALNGAGFRLLRIRIVRALQTHLFLCSGHRSGRSAWVL